MSDAFDKYAQRGAYHWHGTFPTSWLRSSPPVRATYELAIRVLATRCSLERSRGLDIGCGDGVLLYLLRQQGATPIGLDYDSVGLALAQQEHAQRGDLAPHLTRGDASRLPFADDSFDWVSSLEVIEHLEEPSAFLGEVRRVLRPTGAFVCTTPQRRSTEAPGTVHDPYHAFEYTASELQNTLAQVLADVHVYGAFRRWIYHLYLGATGVTFVDRLVRIAVKAACTVANPFTHTTENPTSSWSQLIAVGTAK